MCVRVRVCVCVCVVCLDKGLHLSEESFKVRCDVLRGAGLRITRVTEGRDECVTAKIYFKIFILFGACPIKVLTLHVNTVLIDIYNYIYI